MCPNASKIRKDVLTIFMVIFVIEFAYPFVVVVAYLLSDDLTIRMLNVLWGIY